MIVGYNFSFPSFPLSFLLARLCNFWPPTYHALSGPRHMAHRKMAWFTHPAFSECPLVPAPAMTRGDSVLSEVSLLESRGTGVRPVMDAPHTISSLETLDCKMITGLMKKKKKKTGASKYKTLRRQKMEGEDTLNLI